MPGLQTAEIARNGPTPSPRTPAMSEITLTGEYDGKRGMMDLYHEGAEGRVWVGEIWPSMIRRAGAHPVGCAISLTIRAYNLTTAPDTGAQEGV